MRRPAVDPGIKSAVSAAQRPHLSSLRAMPIRATIAGVLSAGLTLTAACGPAQPDVSIPSTALTHVTVIDGTAQPPKTDQTVVITGDRIAAVGPSREVKA